SPERPNTVVVNGPHLRCDLRQLIDLVLIRIELPHRQVGNLDVEYPAITRDIDVVIDDIWEPHEIVREPGSHSAAGLRMPPMLDIPFHELAPCRTYDVLPRNRGIGIHERHHVLQLITEPERTAR